MWGFIINLTRLSFYGFHAHFVCYISLVLYEATHMYLRISALSNSVCSSIEQNLCRVQRTPPLAFLYIMLRATHEINSLKPPIPLYRIILRLHRSLPPAMRSLGDDYVKAEFRRHQDATNPIHIVGFLSRWQEYAEVVKAGQEGRRMPKEMAAKLSDEQIGQLQELREEVRRAIDEKEEDAVER